MKGVVYCIIESMNRKYRLITQSVLYFRKVYLYRNIYEYQGLGAALGYFRDNILLSWKIINLINKKGPTMNEFVVHCH